MYVDKNMEKVTRTADCFAFTLSTEIAQPAAETVSLLIDRWVGTPDLIVAMANLTIPVLHHIITNEFEQLPDNGGIKQKWWTGEGFPQWSAGMAAMYATGGCQLGSANRF